MRCLAAEQPSGFVSYATTAPQLTASTRRFSSPAAPSSPLELLLLLPAAPPSPPAEKQRRLVLHRLEAWRDASHPTLLLNSRAGSIFAGVWTVEVRQHTRPRLELLPTMGRAPQVHWRLQPKGAC